MTTRLKAPAVGSSQWIQTERQQADEVVRQEIEEFSYSVRNEMEWLNEHMSDIFTKSHINFADVFKTPGKLRGKTPRTARKRDGLAPRQPLVDIFAPNTQHAPISTQKTAFFDKVAHFQIAEDVENQVPETHQTSRAKSPLRAGKPYTDSGYHGMTEDEMEAEVHPASIDASSQESQFHKVPLDEGRPAARRGADGKGEETGTSDDSFVSAKEQESDVATVPDADEAMLDASRPHSETQSPDEHDEENKQVTIASPVTEILPHKDMQQDHDMEADGSQSDTSSPEKPLQRKSSFTFSALPAREPLGSKRSMGPSDAQRNSLLGRSIGSKAADADQGDEHDKSAESRLHNKTSTQLLHERITMLGKTKESQAPKALHQGSISAPLSYPRLPSDGQENVVPANTSTAHLDDDDDDWIAPARPTPTDVRPGEELTANAAVEKETLTSRPGMHQKSMSAANIYSPKPDLGGQSRHLKAMSVSHPNLVQVMQSTTPVGSPMGKSKEGPLSASKNRLWSALKSAKNIFASSASASAAAKLEAHKNMPLVGDSPKREFSADSQTTAVYNMPGALYSEKQLAQSPSRPISLISSSPSRKTRSSSESDKKREKELKAQQKVVDQLEKAREKERQLAAKQQEDRATAYREEAERLEKERQLAAAQALRPESAGSERSRETQPAHKTGLISSGKLRAPVRLMRPTKEAAAPPKPAPVSIRVAAQSQRLGASSVLSKSQHESTGSAPPIARAASSQSLRTGSSALGNARVKALEAAARRKEADEKAAQKKSEQKRELERKRAAKAEEEKRLEEERRAEEQRRAQEAKLAAQRKAEKLAAESKRREQERQDQQRREQERLEQQKREQERRDQERLEQQRREQERLDQQRREQERLEQQRRDEEARKVREAHDLAEAIRRERAQQAPIHPRGDVPGTLRQLAKNVTQIHINPAKPAKRQLPDDGDQQRPGMPRGPPSYQQTDAKRRRTNEEHDEPNQRTSVMAPPKRPSTMRKETLSKYPHGYTHVPPPAPHPSSMFKATVTNQHQMQHKVGHPSQMIQISNARIPFAEPPSHTQAAGASSYQTLASSLHSYENSHAAPNTASKYKTPLRPASQAPMKSTAKSTPSHKNGDHIELPDIATDSEDEDSEDETGGFRAPSWVASPALRDLLTQQQLVDPETVFGPIAELKMDEVFRNSKNQERLKRFRDRGSSALWVESGDAVTSAEKKKDREGRERVVREGGWRYEPGSSAI